MCSPFPNLNSKSIFFRYSIHLRLRFSFILAWRSTNNNNSSSKNGKMQWIYYAFLNQAVTECHRTKAAKASNTFTLYRVAIASPTQSHTQEQERQHRPFSRPYAVCVCAHALRQMSNFSVFGLNWTLQFWDFSRERKGEFASRPHCIEYVMNDYYNKSLGATIHSLSLSPSFLRRVNVRIFAFCVRTHGHFLVTRCDYALLCFSSPKLLNAAHTHTHYVNGTVILCQVNHVICLQIYTMM